MMRTRRPTPLVAALLLVATSTVAAWAQEPAPADLPVTRVVAFTGGVGYFEHEGTVRGDAELRLDVAVEDMDDLLQSLVLQDLDGGTVRPVRYPARDPLPRILDSYGLDLSGAPTLADLLAQARGEAVRVEAGETIEGTIVGVEEVRPPEAEPRTYVTLSVDGGLRRVALAEVREVRFARAELRDELGAALDSIARHRDEGARSVRIRFEGQGERRVRVGYVREMPVWKTSYRLVVHDDGTADLQGWAILDNPTDLDLVDVSVSFVAGHPISFVTELYDPAYVRRPRVGVDSGPAVLPPADEGAFAPAPAARSFADADEGVAAESAADDAAGPDLAGAGVAATTQGTDRGATFEYRADGPVTLARHESAMIPFVGTGLPAVALTHYDPTVSDEHPLRSVRLTNDTDLHLAAGPVTVVGPAGFAGAARMADLPPGESRILAHAIDGDVRVSREADVQPRRVVAVSLAGEVLRTTERERVRTDYAIAGGGEVPLLVVEHPRRDGHEIVAPSPAPPTTRDGARFAVRFGASSSPAPDDDLPTHLRCELDEPCVLTVIEERTVRESIAVTELGADRIRLYLENAELSDDDRAILERILDLSRRVAATERELASEEERLDRIHREQDRIRQNMAALDRDSALYRRYLTDLEVQEEELARLDDALETLRDRRDALRDEASELVGGLQDAP